MARRTVRYVGPVVVELHDEVLFAPGGQVYRWNYRVSRALVRHGKARAPLNKRAVKNRTQPPRGTLRRSVKADTTRIASKVVGIDFAATADYAAYVIRGVPGYIYRRGAGGQFSGTFSLPPNFGIPRKRVNKVRGQSGNNFLADAVRDTGAEHPALAGSVGLGRQVFRRR